MLNNDYCRENQLKKKVDGGGSYFDFNDMAAKIFDALISGHSSEQSKLRLTLGIYLSGASVLLFSQSQITSFCSTVKIRPPRLDDHLYSAQFESFSLAGQILLESEDNRSLMEVWSACGGSPRSLKIMINAYERPYAAVPCYVPIQLHLNFLIFHQSTRLQVTPVFQKNLCDRILSRMLTVQSS